MAAQTPSGILKGLGIAPYQAQPKSEMIDDSTQSQYPAG